MPAALLLLVLLLLLRKIHLLLCLPAAARPGNKNTIGGKTGAVNDRRRAAGFAEAVLTPGIYDYYSNKNMMETAAGFTREARRPKEEKP